MLVDPEPENRMRSAELLTAAGTAGAAFDDRLAAALDDPHHPTASRAAWALARHGDVRSVPTLVHVLDHEENEGFSPSRPPITEGAPTGSRNPRCARPWLRAPHGTDRCWPPHCGPHSLDAWRRSVPKTAPQPVCGWTACRVSTCSAMPLRHAGPQQPTRCPNWKRCSTSRTRSWPAP
ncbi:HEAT repeat domain-containing protein [Streptomyces avermitilis]